MSTIVADNYFLLIAISSGISKLVIFSVNSNFPITCTTFPFPFVSIFFYLFIQSIICLISCKSVLKCIKKV